ncbi:MAG: ATP-dependent DNA ligase [Gemmatimonadaceae bacterium]|nr:ATP-dependent DNA ligase [Gemmatimonadaceae bacterium]
MSPVPAPMLASPAGDLPPLAGWTIEPKWDGIRVIAEVTPKRVALWSRNGINKAAQFPEVEEALRSLAARVGALVLDGELVAVDRTGKPLRFQALQARHLGVDVTRTAFVAFDCLAAVGEDLTRLPWKDRRTVLEQVVPKAARGVVRRGDSFRCGTAGAARLFDAARREGWEGLILKRIDAPYLSGKRSPSWRKVKLEHEQEFVIGGYTLPTDGADRDHFGALLVGYYDDRGALHYAGKVGTGYTRATLASLGRTLAALRQRTSPFVDAPRRAEAIWVKPTLVAQVRYNEMTTDGVLRQPSFLGLRDDKNARDVRLEVETSTHAILDTLRCAS